jgi:recombination-promoting nuclease RpnB
MTMNYNNINNAHDQFFRNAMSNKKVAREFLKTWLPADLCKLVDFNHLEIQPRSYINDLRQESEVDVLFKTIIDGKEAYLYLLLEHQSTPDPLMPFRLLKYTCNIIDQHLKKYGKDKIPLIYPIVVYHGKRKYPFSTNIADLVDAPKELVEQYFLKPFQLIDLGQIDDEKLKQHAWSGVMEFVLKHIFARDILPYLNDIAQNLHYLNEIGGREYIEIVLQYLLERGELSDEKSFFELVDTKISHEVGEKIMSLAERLREKGRLEGKLEGKLEGRLEGKLEEKLEIANSMLDAGSDPFFVAKVTGLSLDKIKALKNRS